MGRSGIRNDDGNDDTHTDTATSTHTAGISVQPVMAAILDLAASRLCPPDADVRFWDKEAQMDALARTRRIIQHIEREKGEWARIGAAKNLMDGLRKVDVYKERWEGLKVHRILDEFAARYPLYVKNG